MVVVPVISLFDMPPNIRQVPHLLNILATGSDSAHPKYALLLGAGASRSSGVPLASEMEDQFKATLFRTQTAFDTIEAFCKARPWDNGDGLSDYATLFGIIYDQPSQRTDYIYSCTKDARPTWGYMYLVNLLKHNKVNVIFTTNFDDLILEACHTHSDNVRPRVYAHEASIRGIRLTSSVPKIIKLHGDFLYDNLKNTDIETQKLEASTAQKLKQLSQEYGLVVVGYSGRDKSVMDAIEDSLKGGAGFSYGVYWCVRKGDSISPRIQELSKNSSVHLVEIDGFDELMADMHEHLGLTLPDDLYDPNQIVTKRYGRLLTATQGVRNSSVVIVRDEKRMLSCIQSVITRTVVQSQRPLFDAGVPDVQPSLGISHEFLSQLEERKGNLSLAADYMIKAYDERPRPAKLIKAFELCALAGTSRRVDLINRVREHLKDLQRDPDSATKCALAAMNAGWFAEAEELLDIVGVTLGDDSGDQLVRTYYIINRLQLKVHCGKKLTDSEHENLKDMLQKPSTLARMGASILLKDYVKASEFALQAMALRELTIDNLSWPIFRLLEGRLPGNKFDAYLQKAGPSQIYLLSDASRDRSLVGETTR